MDEERPTLGYRSPAPAPEAAPPSEVLGEFAAPMIGRLRLELGLAAPIRLSLDREELRLTPGSGVRLRSAALPPLLVRHVRVDLTRATLEHDAVGLGAFDYWFRWAAGKPTIPEDHSGHGAKRWQDYFHVNTDHKVIGRMYLITSFAYFLIGGLMALTIRAELAFRMSRRGYLFRDNAGSCYSATLGTLGELPNQRRQQRLGRRDVRQHLPHPVGALRFPQSAASQRECDVFRDRRHHDLMVGIGEDEAHPLADLPALLRGVETVDRHGAGGGHHETVDHARERRLPAPVRPYDADPSLGQRQVYAVEDGPVTVGVTDLPEADFAHRPVRSVRQCVGSAAGCRGIRAARSAG